MLSIPLKYILQTGIGEQNLQFIINIYWYIYELLFQIGDIRVMFEYAGVSGTEDTKLGPPDTVRNRLFLGFM